MPDGWKGNKPDTEWWVRQVREGMAFRKKHAREQEWQKWRRWYRGEWGRGVLPTNIYFKMIRTIVPRVYYRNPSVSVTATMPGLDHMLLAKLLERADNKLVDLMGVKTQMKNAVQLAIMFGTSWLKLGYGAQYTPTPDDITTDAPDTGGKRLRNAVEYNSLVHADTPWFMNCHPGSVVIPKGCATWESARWICHQVFRPRDDVKEDPRLKNTEHLAEARPGASVYLGSPHESGANVELWEIRDKKTKQVFVMSPGTDNSGQVLFQDDDELQIDGGLNFYPLVFNIDDEAVWGIPDSQIIGPQQQEMNEIRTQIMKHRRIAIVRFLYKAGSIGPDELSKIVEGEPGIGIAVGDINDYKMVDPAGIPTGLLQSEQLAAQDVQEILGLGTNQFGEYAPGSADRSATEANIVNQATQIRIDERRDTCADLLCNFVPDMNNIIMKKWSKDIVLDVVGPAGVPLWIKFRPEMLRDGHYQIKVDPDSSVPQTKAIRQQTAVQLYGLLKSNPLIQPVALTQFLLNELYGVFADDLMLSPIMNTSPSNPMSVGEAAGQLQKLPPANMDKLRAAMAQHGAAPAANSAPVTVPPANLVD